MSIGELHGSHNSPDDFVETEGLIDLVEQEVSLMSFYQHEGFEELVNEYQTLVTTIAKNYAPVGTALFDDLVQEGLIQIWKAWERGIFVDVNNVGGYICLIVRNRIRDVLPSETGGLSRPEKKAKEDLANAIDVFFADNRRTPTIDELVNILGWSEGKVKVYLGLDSNRLSELNEFIPAPAEPIDLEIDFQAACRVIEEMSIGKQDLLARYYGILGKKKMSYKELSDFYGILETTIKTRIFRAKKELRQRYYDRYVK
ncbi:MAG: RNA polymerase sigma factor [Weeksellaceae bacterium]